MNWIKYLFFLVNISSNYAWCALVILLIICIPRVLRYVIKGVPLSKKNSGLPKGYLFCQNGVQKVKGLDLEVEPPHIKLCRVPTTQEFPWENKDLLTCLLTVYLLTCARSLKQKLFRTTLMWYFFVFNYFRGMFYFDVDHLLLCSSLTSNSRRHTEAEAQPVIVGAGMQTISCRRIGFHSFITARQTCFHHCSRSGGLIIRPQMVNIMDVLFFNKAITLAVLAF